MSLFLSPLAWSLVDFTYMGVSLFMGLSQNHPFTLNFPWNKLFMFSILGPFMEPPFPKMFLWLLMIFLWFSYEVPMIFQCFFPCFSRPRLIVLFLLLFVGSLRLAGHLRGFLDLKAGGSTGETKVNKHTMWCPQVISWFIIPLTIDISTISPSY